MLFPGKDVGIIGASGTTLVLGRGQCMPHRADVVGESELETEPVVTSGDEYLPASRCLLIYRTMVRARTMEERMIKMSKSGEGYFWIGGPGEEAFNIPLGLQIKKGRGLDFDFLHLHYRSSPTLLAMGMPMADAVRQMAMTITDPHSMGRNFVGHYAMPEWNVLPVSSVIGVEWVKAIGTGIVQKRHGGDSITVAVGGDAGTSEGDFASCLVWCSRPGKELPVLMIITNNGYGISTPAGSQHGEHHIIDRGKAFGILGALVDGNDPIASWHAVKRAMEYVRAERRPFMLEARVSRLYGHSSSSGAARVKNEADCISLFEQKLLKFGVVGESELEEIRQSARAEVDATIEQVIKEPRPTADDVYRGTYAPSPVDRVYPDEYTGLPS